MGSECGLELQLMSTSCSFEYEHDGLSFKAYDWMNWADATFPLADSNISSSSVLIY